MPPTMYALAALLKKEHEEKLWRSYMSAAAWRMDRFLVGKGFPTFEDSIKPADTRSAEEIKAKILKGLREEVEETDESI